MNANNNTSQCSLHKFSFAVLTSASPPTQTTLHPLLHILSAFTLFIFLQTSFNWTLHVVSPITGWRQLGRVSASHLPSWGSPIAEVDTFAAVSEQDADRKSSYKRRPRSWWAHFALMLSRKRCEKAAKTEFSPTTEGQPLVTAHHFSPIKTTSWSSYNTNSV